MGASAAELTVRQVLDWRLRRQFLTGVGSDGAVGSDGVAGPDGAAGSGGAPGPDGAVAAVERLAGVQAQVPAAAELALALRAGGPAAVERTRRALADGRLLRTWAQRGTLHLLTPAAAADALALIGSARTWEKPAWTREFGATPEQVAQLVETVGELLREAVLTREELTAALVADTRFAALEGQLKSGWGALLKPLAWQGVLCHAPAGGGRAAFTHPGALVPHWPGLPPVEEAGPRLLAAYLGAYGPATPERFDAWLSRNSLRKAVLKGFVAALGDRVAEVRVAGEPALALTAHVEELAAVEPSPSVHLVGAFDQYVLGPGTKAAELLPAAHRAKVSRAGGWIAPLLLVDGRIAGTWEQEGAVLTVTPFERAPGERAPEERELTAAVERLAAAAGAPVTEVRMRVAGEG
ncbi:DNA glycosylase AlkZ-like family protein [Kitasatospora sp. NPDC088134]|uniref:DNA glycosylase AlkZ-like family protein n=1 Tax=Kitasatospora sp. NPDC088134 TaxID=3364071 RepID=UPI003810E80C